MLLSNQEHRHLAGIFDSVHEIETSWTSLAVAGRKRLAAGASFPVALEFVRAREAELARQVDRDVQELAASGLAPTPLVDGNDLIDAGMRPGPRFKSILDAIYDAQLEGRVADHASAMELAHKVASEEAGEGSSG